MMHFQNLDRKSVKRDSEEFDKEFHGVCILICDRRWSQNLAAAIQDLVDIGNVARVSLDAEVHESDF